LYQRLACHPQLEAEFASARSETLRTRRLPLLVDALRTQPDITHILDVGGGDGTSALGIVDHFPAMRVTVLDLPSVIATTRRARDWNVHGERIRLVARDAMHEPWPDGVDCVLFSAFLEIFSEATIRSLLAKAHRLLAPGGVILVNQTACNDLETGPLWPAILSLYFANLASGVGMTYPIEDFRSWILDAGFTGFDVVGNQDADACVMIGKK